MSSQILLKQAQGLFFFFLKANKYDKHLLYDLLKYNALVTDF